MTGATHDLLVKRKSQRKRNHTKNIRNEQVEGVKTVVGSKYLVKAPSGLRFDILSKDSYVSATYG